jgi:hypothetical protein
MVMLPSHEDEVVAASASVEAYDAYFTLSVLTNEVLFDYTKLRVNVTAASKVQRAWRAYQERQRAAKVVQAAWRRWKVKKDELWNPHCFVGVAYLAIQACRDIKDTI